MSFIDFARSAVEDSEFMAEYRRLTGASLGDLSRSGLEAAIDKSSGRQDAEMGALVKFLHDIFCRLNGEEGRG